MQNFKKIDPDKTVFESMDTTNDSMETLLSNNSSIKFPTENLVVGMTCYRTDEEKMYTLKSISPLAWVLTEDLNRDITHADNADKLGGVTAATITNMIAGKEPAFSKNNAFNKNFGNVAGTICQGNDARLSDARPANGGTSAACSGNAATATKLQTARAINGEAFDGTGDITITAAANGGTSAACSGNAATSTTASNATKAGGLAVTTGRNNVANQIVRTDGYGHVEVEYINSNTSVENGVVTNLIYDNGDGYMRKASLEHLISSINGTIPGGRIWIE